MVIARITFKEKAAPYWIEQNPKSNKIQVVTEMIFETPLALIKQLRQIEDAVTECVAIVDGRILALSDFVT